MARTRLVVAYIKVMDHEREFTRGDIAEFMREITNREAAIGAREEELNEREANIREETEGVREQILAALRETEERNEILDSTGRIKGIFGGENFATVKCGRFSDR